MAESKTAGAGYEEVQTVFQQLLTDGWNVGASFTVYQGTERVVHLTGGEAEAGVPFGDEHLVLIASTTKVVEAFVIAKLVSDGLLAYEAPIAKYWPEFAAHGKGHLTVRQLMAHQAGLAAFDRPVSDEQFEDPAAMEKLIVEQSLCWEVADEAGQAYPLESPSQGYHAITRGLVASVLCRKVTGKSLRELWSAMAASLGIGFYIGLPATEEARVSKLHPTAPYIMFRALGVPIPPGLLPSDGSTVSPEPADERDTLTEYEKSFMRAMLFDPSSLPHRALFSAVQLAGVPAHAMNSARRVREIEMPSSNGMANSDAMAQVAALWLHGGKWKGVAWLSEEVARAAAAPAARVPAVDKVMHTPVDFTVGGYARFTNKEIGYESFGWGGAGGQLIRWVPELSLAVAFCTNTLGIRMAMNDPRANRLLDAAVKCARALLKK